ncbi:hypothetical protein INT43_005534 [Umbelopsis isabellina]|uniref:Ubiquitin-like domain-containing protein n=1 Tax=Mortierella isabellina TaxID=91625 RepID=A0A8H7UB20_MORIS|nr:hypothetical protein INT43_005534 [Umbelopsis isabellina]
MQVPEVHSNLRITSQMKLTFKTLQQKQFQLDVDGASTVADLKKKIEETQGHPVETQKLIYSGKILADDNTVESYNISEKDFLVVMVSKPKATKASTSSTPSTPAKVETPKEEPKAAAPVASAASEGTASTQAPVSNTSQTAPAESKASSTGDETKPWNASDALGMYAV